MRGQWFNQLSVPDNFETLSEEAKFKLVLNMPENVRKTAKFLVSMMDSRRLQNKEY